jgi:hypothetical protein
MWEEIARTLFISEATVPSHVLNNYTKTSTHAPARRCSRWRTTWSTRSCVKPSALLAALLPEVQPFLQPLDAISQQRAAVAGRSQCRDGSQQFGIDRNPVPDIAGMEARRILAG